MALRRARTEINDQEEVARLAAAKREALELLIVKLQNEGELRAEEITSIRKVLSETEKTRLVEQAAAENLKQKLKVISCNPLGGTSDMDNDEFGEYIKNS